MKNKHAQSSLSIVEQVHGPDARPIVDYLKGKQDVSEFIIAEKTKMDVNNARRILYHLYEHSLVSYIRRKDKERGWTVSFWTLNLSKAKNLREKIDGNKREALQEELSDEEKHTFYHCTQDGIRVKFDDAFETDFKCPECGSMLVYEDNSHRIQKIKAELKILTAK